MANSFQPTSQEELHKSVVCTAELPSNWRYIDLKYLFNVYNGSTPSSSNEAYWDGDINWITPADMISSKYIAHGTRFITLLGFQSSNLTMLAPGDIVISTRAPIGLVNVVSAPLCTNQGCKSLRPIADVDTSYYYYFLKSQTQNLNALGRGTTFMELSTSDLSNYPVPYPPINEQKAIAQFLDSKSRIIDSIIEDQNRIISLLGEMKYAIISEVVTRGLSPNVELKQSGFSHIGNIPVNWNICRIKNIADLRGRIGWQGLKSSEFTNDGPYVITGVDFDNGHINWDTCNHFSESRFDEDPGIHVLDGDLLITKDGTIGKVAIATNTPEKVSLNSGVMLIRPFLDFDRNYLRYVLMSNQFIDWYNSNDRGNSTIKHLYQEQFYNFRFTMPPIEEQYQISEYLDNYCLNIDTQIQKRRNLIAIIEEYRNSLIFEYVTGKKTVPEGH